MPKKYTHFEKESPDKLLTSRKMKKNLKKTVTSLPTLDDFEATQPHTEYNLEKSNEDNIKGPWPEVLEVYVDLTVHDDPECTKCEEGMMEGDMKFICPRCNTKYQVGTRNQNIIVFRPDVRPACVETVEVPDKYMEDYMHTMYGRNDDYKVYAPQTKTYTTPQGGIDLGETSPEFKWDNATFTWSVNEEDE